MKKDKILSSLNNKTISPKDIVKLVLQDHSVLNEVLDGLRNTKPRIKYGCAKTLTQLSVKAPELVYDYFNFFVELMNSENNILKWNALDIIGNLTAIDERNKFEVIFEEYYDMIDDPTMITAAHIIENSGTIASAKPDLVQKISKLLLNVANDPRESKECTNILLGRIIQSFEKYFEEIENKDEIIKFVKQQLTNTRSGTKKKAQKFLAKHQKE